MLYAIAALLVFNVGFVVGWCLRVLWHEMGNAIDSRWDGLSD